MNELQWKMDSIIGPLYLVATPEALRAILWSSQDVPYAKSLDEAPILKTTVAQLEEYFDGRRRTFDLPLEPKGGTEFQKRVWKALTEIPFGETRSYRELARALHREKACRAVGSANGKNPLSVVVPCHRVINSDGKLGGFAGGLPAKNHLLEMEKRIAAALDEA